MITTPDIKELNELSQWLQHVPYEVIRYQLYNAKDLYKGYEPKDDPEDDKASLAQCYDMRTYKHYIDEGKVTTRVNESLARAIHDNSIYCSLVEFMEPRDPNLCVGIMGGHAIKRSDPMFEKVVLMSKRLTEEGFLMVSGGGPGAMEATHLGAWMAGHSGAKTKEVVAELAKAAETSKDSKWVSSALDIMARYPQTKYESLGVPTWLYSQEPSTPFATHIAKFFENSVREDVILSISSGGIIYTPGSAGTLQEIFQDAGQNHYLSHGLSSPMIFLGKHFWTEEVPVYSLIKHLLEEGKYQNLQLTLTDDMDEVESVLKEFQKTMVTAKPPMN